MPEMFEYRGPAPTVPLLKCPTCGADDSFTSWERTTTGYAGVRFFEAPNGTGREIDYDGVTDNESADDGGGEFADDITCTNCDTLNLTLASLVNEEGKTGEVTVSDLDALLTGTWDSVFKLRIKATSIALKMLGMELGRVRPDAVSVRFNEDDDSEVQPTRAYVPYDDGIVLADGSFATFDPTDDDSLDLAATVVAGIDWELIQSFPDIATPSPQGTYYLINLQAARDSAIRD